MEKHKNLKKFIKHNVVNNILKDIGSIKRRLYPVMHKYDIISYDLNTEIQGSKKKINNIEFLCFTNGIFTPDKNKYINLSLPYDHVNRIGIIVTTNIIASGIDKMIYKVAKVNFSEYNENIMISCEEF